MWLKYVAIWLFISSLLIQNLPRNKSLPLIPGTLADEGWWKDEIQRCKFAPFKKFYLLAISCNYRFIPASSGSVQRFIAAPWWRRLPVLERVLPLYSVSWKPNTSQWRWIIPPPGFLLWFLPNRAEAWFCGVHSSTCIFHKRQIMESSSAVVTYFSAEYNIHISLQEYFSSQQLCQDADLKDSCGDPRQVLRQDTEVEMVSWVHEILIIITVIIIMLVNRSQIAKWVSII